MRRRIVQWVLAGLAGCVVLGGCGGLYAIWLTMSYTNDRGSPVLAAEWRTSLLAAPGPDEAAADPDVVVLRFANGEWVFGKSQDSHAWWRHGGGTLVIRDSRGRVRAFFGHMCGARYMEDAFGRKHPSLDAFYDKVLQYKYVEHIFPDDPGAAPDRRPAK